MATPVKELGYGDVEVYVEETLGIGSYGKVCKAKCGQLPCAAKLLHDTMFGTNDPGIRKFVERFEQECGFLRMIKHPNIVQFLGTVRDPRSRRLALLMELMDESLTRFLEQSTGPLPYHTQLNICQDVALALAYLHSNDIIHRDLSSNNVLLIGEGIRAKVTDFGMSKLIGINPRMTPLTMCPGTQAYMPPEALATPPRYSNKLDCFSHGVLAIQIATRQFPNPTDAQTTVEDARYPTGFVHVPVPERERRKKDIALVDPNHPLLPLALHCLKEWDKERPSADEVCGRLATLKGEQMYTRSVEQSREQSVSVQTLQQQIQEKDGELARARANQEQLERAMADQQQQVQEKEDELQRARVNHLQQVQEKEDELQRTRVSYETEFQEYSSKIQEKSDELAKARANHATEIRECHATYQQQIAELRSKLHNENPQLPQTQEKTKEVQQLHELPQKQQQPTEVEVTKIPVEKLSLQVTTDPVKLTWRRGREAPKTMSAYAGAAVVHGNTAYFSRSYNVHSYTLANDEWTSLPECEYLCFGLAVVNDKVTTIGGCSGITATNTLLCLEDQGTKWRKLLPPMPTARDNPATTTTPTHLIVAGGRTGFAFGVALSIVEILDTNTLQWSSASSSPKALECPHMSLCGEHLYLSEDNTIFSCSVEELLKSRKPASINSSDNVWTKLSNIPVPYWASLTTLRGQVLTISGSDQANRGIPTGAIHQYNRSTNSWSVIGEMPTPRSRTLVAVLPSNELIAVGGEGETGLCAITEIANTK